ncbi:MAG: hypothetical protein ACHQT8_05560 [Chlamydiales bacterium]
MASQVQRTVSNQFVNWNSCQYSATTCLAVKNHAQLQGRAEMIRGEETTRKVVSGIIAPVVILLIAVVETVARGVLALGVKVYQARNTDEQHRAPNAVWWRNISANGALLSAETVATSALEIYNTCSNWNRHQLPYDALVEHVASIPVRIRQQHSEALNTMNLISDAPGPVPVAAPSSEASPSATPARPPVEAATPAA